MNYGHQLMDFILAVDALWALPPLMSGILSFSNYKKYCFNNITDVMQQEDAGVILQSIFLLLFHALVFGTTMSGIF